MDVTVAKPIPVNPENEWRSESPGHQGWARSPRPDAAKKYFICSVDSHIAPPIDLAKQLKSEHQAFLPRFETDAEGTLWQINEKRKMRFPLENARLQGEDDYRQRAGKISADDPDRDMAIRLADMDRDGIDYEVAFPNGWALSIYGIPDFEFLSSAFNVYNAWAAELNKTYSNRVNIIPAVATLDVDQAVKDLEKVAKLGHTIVNIPTHPHPADHKQIYSDPKYDKVWAAITELNLPIMFHVATGGDPRRKSGPGGAIINRLGSHDLMAEVICTMCVSGVLDRFPKLRFNGVEGGGGWLPALMDLMDETYVKHHFWVKPKLKHGLPSEYFREHGMVSFQEDRSALLLCEPYNLSNNMSWSSDYPHHEGTFPHSAAAIERQFNDVSEETRTKILGLNAARFLGLEVPARFRS
jgi:predicted TIM-barrel fold metal-dependent hydrolase